MSRRNTPSTTRAANHSPKNIVVFGESGVGKSSLINLMAGRSIAATSSSAKGCTFQHKKYELQVDDTTYAIWDTAGLDEGAYGTVPAEIAEENLKRLLHDLSRAHGIHLLIYCIRASRLRKTLLGNYNLFYSAICRKKVPIVTVVTGLENYEEHMHDWWTANESELAAFKMHFDGHACVTTLNAEKVNSPILKQRCHASREAVLSLISDTCARDRWGADREGWVSAALADVRAMCRPGRNTSAQPTPIVALYDISERPRNASAFEGGRLMDVGGSPLLVFRIHDDQLHAGAQFRKHVACRDADLLIACTSFYGDAGASRRAAAAFYGSYGGDTRPLLIVVKDAPSDERAQEWWNTVNEREDERRPKQRQQQAHPTPDPRKLQAVVRALPRLESPDATAAVARVRHTIQTRTLQPVDVVPSGCFGWIFGGKRGPMMYSGTDVVPSVEDGLTNANVWTPRRSRA